MTTQDDGRIGGRPRTPEGVLPGDADCEVELDYVLALYLGRDDFCSVLIEDLLLDRLGHDKKLKLLRRILGRHGLTFSPYDTLPAELEVLRKFRNDLAHTVGRDGDPWQRIRRRGGANEVVPITAEQVIDQLQRAMACQSAVHLLPLYLEAHPPDEPRR